jgi:hypothetical protein
MDEHQIHNTCKLHGYVTPCSGSGGLQYHQPRPADSTKTVKDIKVVFANSKSFIGLREPVSSLCKSRYGSLGRVDARCNDGWQNEGKSAGKPICEDDNSNQILPCSMLKASCSMDAVQARCAKTCNTFNKGSKECKQIASQQDKYKCVRAFSCQPMAKAYTPQGMAWTKPRAAKTQGCGPQANIELGMCTSNPKKVKCGCRGAYELDVKSISTNDCSQRDYDDEEKRILDKLASIEPQTSQWASSCTSVPESVKPYISKPVDKPPMQMKKGKVTVWELSKIHARSVPMEKDGCLAEFTMSISLCNTAPLKRIKLDIPFTGAQYLSVGCGCQEIIGEATYSAQILGMANKMQATQDTCAKHFTSWVQDFHQQYFFSGLKYHWHAIRLAKEVRSQCTDAGVKPTPDVEYELAQAAVADVMKRNQESIKKQETELQTVSEQAMRLRKSKAKCMAGLPKESDNFKLIVDHFSIEPDKKLATNLQGQAAELKGTLDERDHNKARMQAMQPPAQQ